MKVPKGKASNTLIVRQFERLNQWKVVLCRWLKTQAIHQCESLNLSCKSKQRPLATATNGPIPQIPCADTVCCFWRSGSGCWVAAETAVFLWGKLSFQPLWLYTLQASTLARFQLWPVCPQQHDTFRTNLGLNLRPSPGLCFSLIFWLWAVRPYAPPVLVFGISCSTHNVNLAWTGLHYFWR